MLKLLCQRAFGLASAFMRAQKGSILIYTGAFMAIGVGGAAVSIDVGRIILLRTQMQNRADAGALAGAAQLDAGSDAVDRAVTIATSSMQGWTSAVVADAEIKVKDVRIFRSDTTTFTTIGVEINTAAPTAEDDSLARFIQVDLERIALSFFYGPAASVLTGEDGATQVTLDGYAIAMSDPYICKAQPLMICDPFDNGDGTSSQELVSDANDANVGKQITLKPPSTNANDLIGGGNFGLLALPDDAGYGNGASAIEKSLSDQEPQGCYALSSVTTTTGNMVNKVAAGINTRFGDTTTYMPDPKPAPNVINYPKDADVTGLSSPPLLGNGVWDFSAYWADKHPTIVEPSTVGDFPANPTRYQTYLFENDITFFTKNNTTSTETEDPSQGWKEVDPNVDLAAGAVVPEDAGDPTNRWEDGKFDNGSVSTLGYERRLLKLALLRCVSENLNGKTTTQNPERYVEMFLTQEVVPPGQTDLGDSTSGQGAIYAEIVRKLTPQTSLEFHGNVRLIE